MSPAAPGVGVGAGSPGLNKVELLFLLQELAKGSTLEVKKQMSPAEDNVYSHISEPLEPILRSPPNPRWL